VGWIRQAENTGDYSVVPSDRFMVQISYLTNSDPVIRDLLTSPSSSSGTSGRIRFVQKNTTFMLRGRGVNDEYGRRDFSDWFGPFVAYTSPASLPPSVTSVLPSQPMSLTVSWAKPGTSSTSCYNLRSFEVECTEEGSSNLFTKNVSFTTSTALTGLRENSYYSCHVRGFLFAQGLGDSFLSVGMSSPYSGSIRMYTLPRGELISTLPSVHKNS